MKKFNLFAVIFASVVALSGCSNNPYTYFQHETRHNLLKENWTHKINVDPNRWTEGAGDWFLTGRPDRVEKRISQMPSYNAFAARQVRLPDFDRIIVDANIDVQILGDQENENLAIAGSYSSERDISIHVRGRTLFITQVCEKVCAVNNTIVRVGINNLRRLTNIKSAHIVGRSVNSDHLDIQSGGDGDIILAGGQRLNLSSVTQRGAGKVTVLNANTPHLMIDVVGNGSVNVNGRVGINFIRHDGDGEVNILGAVSDSLSIDASGNGTTSLLGYANLKKISAMNNSQVYLYWVRSVAAFIDERDNARVGLAGKASNLNIDITDNTRFEGSYLYGDNVYVNTAVYAHANVAPQNKLFALAQGGSSIYYYPSPRTVVSQSTTQYAMIVPVTHKAN